MAEKAGSKRRASKKPVKKTGKATQPKLSVGAALPGEECRVPAHESWTEAEAWVWREVCDGRVADFNARDGLDKPLDPNDPDAWQDGHEERTLSPAFLEAVLLREPWRSAIPRHGVRIAGALFADPLDLSHARVSCQLWLEYCRLISKIAATDLRVEGWFSLEGSSVADVDLSASDIRSHVSLQKATLKGKVVLNNAKIGGFLSMSGAAFKGEVDMSSVDVTSHLLMRALETSDGFVHTTTFADKVILGSAKIRGQLDMSGATFEGEVGMGSLDVAGSLFMNALETSDGVVHTTTFADKLVLAGAKIGGFLSMSGAAFEGEVAMDSLDVASHLFMGTLETHERVVQATTFTHEKNKVILRAAKVGGQLDMSGAAFADGVDMGSLDVASSLFMRNATFGGSVDLLSGKLGGNLDISNTEFAELDLTGTSIAGELRLGSEQHDRTRWRGDGRMVLRNTDVGALQDRIDEKGKEKSDAWPEALQLDGFTYDRLGGFAGSGAAADMFGRGSKWYVDWLRRDATYSPQPYEQLAKVLREAGHTVMAYDVLYASRERAREESRRFKWLGLTVLKWTIGYGLGIRYFWCLGWATLFTVVGAVVHWWGSGQATDPDIFRLAWLSFDQLLPIAELDKVHADLVTEGVLERWALAYFYVHKLIGWLLASFLVAGLAGLTQK